jgi:hypothetical protein
VLTGVLAGDTEAVRQTPAQVIAVVRRRRAGLVTWAAAQGAPNAVELLAAAGSPRHHVAPAASPSTSAGLLVLRPLPS